MEAFELDLSPAEQSALAILWTLGDPKLDEREVLAALRADDVPYGCFSDFSAHSLELDGHLWPTSEHCFLAQKFIGTRHADLIRRARTPLPAAELGRARPNCCGGTGTGKNMLGRILTRTGNQLRVVEVPGSHERSG